MDLRRNSQPASISLPQTDFLLGTASTLREVDPHESHVTAMPVYQAEVHTRIWTTILIIIKLDNTIVQVRAT